VLRRELERLEEHFLENFSRGFVAARALAEANP